MRPHVRSACSTSQQIYTRARWLLEFMRSNLLVVAGVLEARAPLRRVNQFFSQHQSCPKSKYFLEIPGVDSLIFCKANGRVFTTNRRLIAKRKAISLTNRHPLSVSISSAQNRLMGSRTIGKGPKIKSVAFFIFPHWSFGQSEKIILQRFSRALAHAFSMICLLASMRSHALAVGLPLQQFVR